MNLSKIYGILKNKYLIITVLFFIWMVFWDENSWLVHQKIDQEIKKLDKSIAYYQKQVRKDSITILMLRDSLEIEKIAREKYFMKKENEDVFIIEYQ